MTNNTQANAVETVRNNIVEMLQFHTNQRNIALRAVEQQSGAIAALEQLLRLMENTADNESEYPAQTAPTDSTR